MGEDVLTDTDSAVVRWLAGNDEHLERTVNDLDGETATMRLPDFPTASVSPAEMREEAGASCLGLRHSAGLPEGCGSPSIWQVAASTSVLFAVAAFFSLMPKFVLVRTATLRRPLASV